MPSFNDHLPNDEAENTIRHEMAKLTVEHLTKNYGELLKKSSFLQQIHEKWWEKKRIRCYSFLRDQNGLS